jgi:choline dehydrogenase-like flavoprotein
VRGIQIGRQIARSAAFARYGAREVQPWAAVRDEAAIADYVRRSASTVHHPVGTCRMSGTDTQAVVDSQLRVRGVEALRVVDASVFPSLVGGNTNAPTVMVAERAADMLLGRPQLPAFAG